MRDPARLHDRRTRRPGPEDGDRPGRLRRYRLLRGEPAASEIKPLLDPGAAELTAVGVAEFLDHLVRLVGAGEEDAILDLAELGLVSGIVVDVALGTKSGLLKARRDHRTRLTVRSAWPTASPRNPRAPRQSPWPLPIPICSSLVALRASRQSPCPDRTGRGGSHPGDLPSGDT